ncbi:MAG: hypothetical protein BMS9Abin29_2052 [Gemmatimonadota bacterium]|nr:MAG: hypothetical protein BMS9Abin29_2052 [Gemmatimonadota bacterium]
MGKRRKRRPARSTDSRSPAEVAYEAAEEKRRQRRLGIAAAVLVLGIQIAATVMALNPAPHNGGDNAGYLSLAHSLVTAGTYVEQWDPEARPHTKYPPVYPAILAGAMVVGAEGWGAFKAISVFFVVVSVFVTFLWALERRGPGFAVVLALLLAFSPAMLWSSRWILSDPPFLALTLLTLWAFHHAARERASPAWLWAGAAAAILATFTRTAGLPLVLAVGGWLVLERRWKSLAAFGAAFALPSGFWWLRSQNSGGAEYVSEFWMINPYDPDLGNVGVGGLASRVLENLNGYVFTHIPAGLAPYPRGVLAALGLMLVGAAVVGWALRLRRERSVTELFTPLYFGLILVWPAVWSGDRFALPLYPLLLFYAGEALVDGSRRLHRRLPWAVAGLAVAVLGVPAVHAWSGLVREASACAKVVEESGPFGCYSIGFQEFTLVARWAGENLPDGAAVFTRKPRIFYTLSGVPSRTYPLSRDPERFFREADAAGIEYVVLDRVDQLGELYVGSVVGARPEAFCSLIAARGADGGRTDVLGILGPDASGVPAAESDQGEVSIQACPPAMVRAVARDLPPYSASRLPLLTLPRP